MSVRVLRGLPRADHSEIPAQHTRVRVIDGARYQARLEAERIVGHAEAEARRTRQEAEQQAAEARRLAVIDGRAEGNAIAAVMIARVRQEQLALLERGTSLVIAAARAIAERAVGEAIALDDGKLAAWASEAIGAMRGAARISLHAHPAAIARLAGLAARLPIGTTLRFVEDSSLPAGALLARTELGEVAIDLPTQLELLGAALTDPIAAELSLRANPRP